MAVSINGNGTVTGLTDLTSSDLTVDTNTLHVDSANNRVGVGTITPTTALDVSGTVNATAFTGDGSSLTGVGNETITLSGDVTGSGTTAITTTVGNDSHSHTTSTLSGNISAFTNDAGYLTSGGKVLQVVQDTLVGKVSTTSTGFVDTGLSVSITPSSTSSKVLVLASMSSIGANVTAMFQLVRNTTNIATGTGGTYNPTEGITVDATGRALHAGFNYLDSPATTSATTYKVQYKQNGGGSVSINGRVSDSYIGAHSTIIAIEVGA